MASNNFQITDLTDAQSDKVTTINENIQLLEDAVAESVQITVTADFALTDAQFNENIFFDLIGTPGAGFTVELPARKGLLIVDNNSGQTATFEVDPDSDGADGTTTDVGDGETFLLYCDGTNVIPVGSAGGGGGSSTLLGLTDTPSAYTGQSGRVLKVNVGEDGLEFADDNDTGGGGGSSSGGPARGVRLTLSTDFTLTASGSDTIDWEVEDFDDAGLADVAGANPSRITVPSGVTRMEFSAGCQVSGTGTADEIFLLIRKNGTTEVARDRQDEPNTRFSTVSTGILDVVAGDYFEMVVASEEADDLEAVDNTFFSGQILEIGANLTVSEQTGTTYTFDIDDADTYVQLNNAGAITATIPPNSSVAYGVGTTITIEQEGAGTVTIAPGSGVTLNSRGSLLSTAGQYAVATCVKVDTDTWTVTGDLT